MNKQKKNQPKSEEEMYGIEQRKMNVVQGRLMAIYEALGRFPTDAEQSRATTEAITWMEMYTDEEGSIKSDAPHIRSGLESWEQIGITSKKMTPWMIL